MATVFEVEISRVKEGIKLYINSDLDWSYLHLPGGSQRMHCGVPCCQLRYDLDIPADLTMFTGQMIQSDLGTKLFNSNLDKINTVFLGAVSLKDKTFILPHQVLSVEKLKQYAQALSAIANYLYTRNQKKI